MDKYILVTSKPWHKDLFKKLAEYKKEIKWVLIDNENLFVLSELKKINPKKIFILIGQKLFLKKYTITVSVYYFI